MSAGYTLQSDGQGHYRLLHESGRAYLLHEGPVDWAVLWRKHPEAVLEACGAAFAEARQQEAVEAMSDSLQRHVGLTMKTSEGENAGESPARGGEPAK